MYTVQYSADNHCITVYLIYRILEFPWGTAVTERMLVAAVGHIECIPRYTCLKYPQNSIDPSLMVSRLSAFGFQPTSIQRFRISSLSLRVMPWAKANS
jgi:hypothetical protein